MWFFGWLLLPATLIDVLPWLADFIFLREWDQASAYFVGIVVRWVESSLLPFLGWASLTVLADLYDEFGAEPFTTDDEA